MVINPTSFNDVSLIAIVPDNECRIPTLMGPVSAAGAAAAGADAAKTEALSSNRPTNV
jgi:hypothetical protein